MAPLTSSENIRGKRWIAVMSRWVVHDIYPTRCASGEEAWA